MDLVVEGVSVNISGKLILDSVSVDVPAGGMTLITGRSGAGKSTLINAVLGFIPVVSGVVRVGDQHLLDGDGGSLAGLRRRIGIVYQDPLLLAELTVSENVLWMARLRGHSIEVATDLTQEALSAVDVDHLATRRVHNLSGGEAQRVSVARAVVGDPLIVLADEPTSALDSKNSHVVGSLLSSLAVDRQIPLLVASHDPVLADYARDVILLEDGHVAVAHR